jgi:hypothetical protein
MKLYRKYLTPKGRAIYLEYEDEPSGCCCEECEHYLPSDGGFNGICDVHARFVEAFCHCLSFEPQNDDE